MSAKKTLEEQIGTLTLASNAWVEPMREWLKTAVSLCETAKNAEPTEIKQAFLQMDGLNLFLTDKKARLLPRAKSHSPQENIWLALRAAKEKERLTRSVSKKSFELAERQGFEPWVRLPAHTRSRRAPSTTRSPLHRAI